MIILVGKFYNICNLNNTCTGRLIPVYKSSYYLFEELICFVNGNICLKNLRIYVPRINICFVYANICLENARIYVQKINICFIDGNICFEN